MRMFCRGDAARMAGTMPPDRSLLSAPVCLSPASSALLFRPLLERGLAASFGAAARDDAGRERGGSGGNAPKEVGVRSSDRIILLPSS